MIFPGFSDSARRVLKGATPPAVWIGLRRLRASWKHDLIRFSGEYGSWAEAVSASGNYGNPAIIDRVIGSARRVKNGEAAFERDGVAFLHSEYNFPLVFALLRAGARDERINVIDFGGSLGSSYFQNRSLLSGAVPIRWAVVEQPDFVEVGKREFCTSELSFHESIEDAHAHVGSGVLLLSSVLQYLPDPAEFLEQAVSHAFQSVIIDRTPFMVDDRTRLTVQHVPQQIYAASYPVWFFDASLLQNLGPRYKLIASWPALDTLQPAKGRAVWKGFLHEFRNEQD
jgi:putative methyltransferase (TIGR04325 family)